MPSSHTGHATGNKNSKEKTVAAVPGPKNIKIS